MATAFEQTLVQRMVTEAVIAIFGEGLQVGLLIQGKKVKDDNKTLLQTRICHDDKLESLGFALEPKLANTPPPLCPEDPSFLRVCEAHQLLSRYPMTPMTNLDNFVKIDDISIPTPTDMSMDKIIPDSRAVVVPAMSVEALAVVPSQKNLGDQNPFNTE